MTFKTALHATLAVAALTAWGTAIAQNRGGPPISRVHTATQAQDVNLITADQTAPASAYVNITDDGSIRTITSNGIPAHDVGAFPNSANPNQISAQDYHFTVPVSPELNTIPSYARVLFGVAVNGVPFEPGTAEVWQGDRRSGWNYDALGGAIPLGLDENNAHVQPTGAYHYHSLPVGLMQNLNWRADAHSPLIGYAADGFPIYALTGSIDGQVTLVQSSWQLSQGTRPGGEEPTGIYDGTFVQDYTYSAGEGDLDECNGMWTVSEDYPSGTYAYFLTMEYPYIPRCLMGDADASFARH